MNIFPYLDLFSGNALPAAARKDAAMKAVRLVGALRSAGFEAMGGFSLPDYATYTKENNNKMSLSPVFDLRYHGSGEGQTMIVYAAKDGVPVASCGIRLVWLSCSLAASMERQEFWYGADRAAATNEPCVVTAPLAARLEHVHIAWTGATSNFSGFRGATSALVRLTYLYAAANWHWTALVGISEPHIAYVENRERPFSRAHDIYGFASAEAAVQRGKTRFILMSSPRGYVEHFIARRDFDMLEIKEERAKASA
jgi:hypothetical protein